MEKPQNSIFYKTRRLGNVRSHNRFRPPHPQFWHIFLPNEEQIEKTKNYFWESQKTQKKPKHFPKKNV